jgi:isopenicillin N synthase-like dioxygenase
MVAMPQIPIIDIAPLVANQNDQQQVAEQIGAACRDHGFFYIVGHGIDPALIDRLETVSRQFFAQDLAVKQRIRMELGGPAWRGYFPVGNELTSGKPDQKEGLYFGSELPADHPRVRAGLPLHGGNLFPDVPGFRETVLEYFALLTELGQLLMRGIALSLQLDGNYFRAALTADPILLFRIFHYPPLTSEAAELWSVGEHTDYGLLTILKQDQTGGLQVKSQGTWIDAPPIPAAFVCNIGDMLDRMTGGLYQSTPHRVRNRSQQGRLSFPFFFDPGWDAEVEPLSLTAKSTQANLDRWDGTSLQDLKGTYGEYLLGKIAKVFPELSATKLTQQP